MKETNMEHFREKLEWLIGGEAIETPAVVDGKPVSCTGMSCGDCDLYEKTKPCRVALIKWLMSEYKEKPVLTEREKINGILEGRYIDLIKGCLILNNALDSSHGKTKNLGVWKS